METAPKPRSVERIGEEFLAIVWEDGHESFFESPYLRKRCPCAACQVREREERPSAQVRPGLALLSAPPRLIGLEDVGRYALRLRWSDGHSTGIYEFRLLRSICPCDACRGA